MHQFGVGAKMNLLIDGIWERMRITIVVSPKGVNHTVGLAGKK